MPKIDKLYHQQEELWSDSGTLNNLEHLLLERRRNDRCLQILQDLHFLREETAAENPDSLQHRICPEFKVDVLSRIDAMRVLLKEQRKHEKHNFGPHKDFNKALKDLKELRKNIRKATDCSFPPSLLALGSEVESAAGRNGADRTPISGSHILDIPEEYIKVSDLTGCEKTDRQKLDLFLYKKLRKERKIKRGALAAAGVGAAAMGVSLTIAGAACVGAGFGGLVPLIGVGGAVILAGAGEIALAVGPTLAIFGASGALYKRFQIDPATKKFLRRHYIEQMADEVYQLNGRERVLSFKNRMDLVESWAGDFDIHLCCEEVIWYAAKDNFPRFLELRHAVGNRSDKDLLRKLMHLERRNLIWAELIDEAEDFDFPNGRDLMEEEYARVSV